MPDIHVDPEADIFTPIATLLQTTRGISSSWQKKTGAKGAPLYIWEPRGGAIEHDDVDAGFDPLGPRVLATWRYEVDIFCRAESHGDAVAMLEGLVTAIRSVVKVAHKLDFAEVTDGSGEPSTAGKQTIKLVAAFRLPLYEQRLDQPDTAWAEVLTVGIVTDPTAVDPDGTLQLPDT